MPARCQPMRYQGMRCAHRRRRSGAGPRLIPYARRRAISSPLGRVAVRGNAPAISPQRRFKQRLKVA
jgi:hypothetical protein